MTVVMIDIRSQMDSWQRWSMRGTENPENEVQFLENPQKRSVRLTVRTSRLQCENRVSITLPSAKITYGVLILKIQIK